MFALMLSAVAVLAACDQKEVQKAVDEAMDKDLPVVEQENEMMEDDKKMDNDDKEAMKKDDSMGEDDKEMEDEKMDQEEKMDDEKMMDDDKDDKKMMDDEKMEEDHKMEDDKKMEDDAMEKEDPEVKADDDMMDKEEEPSAMKKESGQYVAYSDGVIGNGQKSVLFFHAPWCPACKQNDEYLSDWYGSEEFPVSVYKVDYDTASELKKKYGITGQDTFVQIDGAGNAITQARFPSQSALRGLLQ